MLARHILTPRRSLTSSTVTRSWFGDLFGNKSSKITSQQKRSDIIEKQDDYINKEITKIAHLTRENSPQYLKKKQKDKLQSQFKVRDWKNVKFLHAKDLEGFYDDKVKLQNVVNQSYKDVTGTEIGFDDYSSIDLHDLKLRFAFVKHLQSNLGFELNDYVVSTSHDLISLYYEVEKVVNKRWSNERNPNAIVLRQSDFSAKNLYLNESRDEYEKHKEFTKLLKEVERLEQQSEQKA
ncbi:hypothetical protein CANMA_003011 [Candida margitis]|uniref:uncharacterized protein n=1 Tax=Candida margitis TaxID=1775924 RepID=UPI0022263208|nr:uncharacterized protein CANMA_003011 [Candida margitis]KAI5967577.1 hypothetical protein CANMA_003011 [Candida margitis]